MVQNNMSPSARDRVGKLIASGLSRRAVMEPEKSVVPKDEIWTTEEVAEYLRCSPDHVRVEAKKGRIPGFQLGSLWRFRAENVRGLGR